MEEYMQTIGIDYDENWLKCGRIQNTDKPEFVKLKQFSANKKGVKGLEDWLNECSSNHADIVIGMTISDATGAALAYILSQDGYTIAPLAASTVFHAFLAHHKRKQPAELMAMLVIDRQQHFTPMSDACLKLRSELFEREIKRIHIQRNEAHNEKFTGQAFDFLMQLTANAVNNLESQLAESDQKISDMIQINPEFKRDFDILMTMPCMDHWAAQALVFFFNAYPAQDARHFASCLGLGDGARLDKDNYRVHDLRVVRGPLYSAAQKALSEIPAFKSLGDRMAQNGKDEPVIVVAAMNKIARIAWKMLKNKQVYAV